MQEAVTGFVPKKYIPENSKRALDLIDQMVATVNEPRFLDKLDDIAHSEGMMIRVDDNWRNFRFTRNIEPKWFDPTVVVPQRYIRNKAFYWNRPLPKHLQLPPGEF